MSETVLSVKSLSKSFGALKATDDVSLDLRAGEIHAHTWSNCLTGVKSCPYPKWVAIVVLLVPVC